MKQELKLYSIEDSYVQYLNQYDRRVTSNKEDDRIFERKYLGVVLNMNGIDYFVPLASPKNSDYYLDKNNVRRIRKSIIPIMRIVHKENNESLSLIGTLKFNNMIPAFESVVVEYDIEKEADLDYKNLVYKEWDFIRTNKVDILRNARIIYGQKTNKVEGINYLNNTVDFLLLEIKAKEYVAYKQQNR